MYVSVLIPTLLLIMMAVANLPEKPPDMDKVISAYAKQHGFCGTILVEDHGRVILCRSFGLADRAFSIPNKRDTKYKLASITKLFTSTMVMQLCEQGRIDLNQPIKAYLPEYKGEGAEKVTIYHLLTATSGIENFDKGGEDGYLKPMSRDELLTRFCSGKLENEPGSRFNYNNADYIILGKIIEAVCGKSYEQVLEQQILGPLKMNHTGMCTRAVVDGLANSYEWNGKDHVAENETPYCIENFYAAGAMYSTVDDLLTFSDALFGEKLLRSSTLEMLLKPNLADYACGLWVSDYNVNGVKLRVAERQGSIGGTTNRLLRLLDKDVTIILLTNMGPASMDAMQLHIMSKYIPGMELPTFSAGAFPSEINASVGSEVALSVKLMNTGGRSAGNLLDIEVKDESGTKVGQTVKEEMVFERGESKAIAYVWTPKKPGKYSVCVGVFQADWRVNYLWVDSIATIHVK